MQADKGKIALAGAFGDPVEGGYLIFKNSTAEVTIILHTSLFLYYSMPVRTELLPFPRRIMTLVV